MSGARLVIELELDGLSVVLDCLASVQYLPAGVNRPSATETMPLLHRLLTLMQTAQAEPLEFPTIPGELT